MEFLTSFLGRNGYLPHGYCFTWTPGLLWAMVTADSVIAAAYFSIPLAMVSFFRRRPEPSLRWVAWLFIVFIFACGLTHVMDVWTIWRPDYGVQALTKVVTAMASLVTAVVLWFMIPRALKIPSVEQLRSVIASLEAEIGKRRSAEDRLHDLQQNLAITLSSIGAGFIATDRDGCITRMNGVAEQVTGWSQPQALGQGIRQVFVQEGVQEGRPVDDAQGNPVDEMMAQGTTVDTVVHVVGLSRSGQRTPLEVRAALTHADDGTVRGIAMVFRDMSRIEEAEAESSRLGSSQRQAEAALRNSEARLRFTLESAQIGDWDLDLATGVSTRSMRHDRCFGYDTEQAEWSFDKFIQHVHPQERAAVTRRFHLAADHQEDWRDECRVVWPDGSVHWISVTGSVLLEGGKASRMLGIVVDITEQKMAEQTRLTAQRLEAENREIQAASRLKSQFLANMSHELRTPLNAIIGFAELLHSGAVPVESPKNREFLGHIGTSGRHLLQLINDVLDLSKVESGKFEFFPEPVNLVSLVNEANDILHTSIQRKSLAVSVDIDPTLTDIVVDAGRLKQALYNYLSNAIKFTPESGWVAVRASAEGPAHFRIEVEDNGIGISEADMARLFTEFQQLDAGYGKQHPGTGLGLALTRKLVQAQGGSVGVRSTEGVGSVFHLVLARVPTVVSTQGLPDVATELAQHRLLVIEDERHAQALLVEALSESGFQVDAAGTGQQAVAQASVKA
ncbi:MAG: sensor hybrid histidine kinase, partial [Rhizobacter sp.]|nr:sensor hybrid histidine kinase [Rhizobacter sp.]